VPWGVRVPRDRAGATSHAEPVTAATGHGAVLRAIQAELAELAAQRARLPVRELRKLDEIEHEREQLRGQRDDVAPRLASVTAPQRGRRSKLRPCTSSAGRPSASP
jgi:hypothetical protein